MKKGYFIEDYQLEELQSEKLYINKYDIDLKYLYEMNKYWKEFLFDLIAEGAKKGGLKICKTDNLIQNLKEQYNLLIKSNNLSIDKKDYVELEDYITFKEWLEIPGHDIIFLNSGKILLVQEI